MLYGAHPPRARSESLHVSRRIRPSCPDLLSQHLVRRRATPARPHLLLARALPRSRRDRAQAHEEQPLALRVARDTERWFIGKLAAMTPSEVEVAVMMIDAKQRPDPLAFLNPVDPCVPNPKAAEPIRHRGEPPDALA